MWFFFFFFFIPADLKRKTAETVKQYEENQVQVLKWTEYKNKGSIEHAKHIKLLEEELVDMQKNFEEMRGMLATQGIGYHAKK